MIQISPARPSDLPDILTMVRALCAFHGDTATVSLERLQDMFFGPQATATGLIARDKDIAIGYAGLTSVTVIHDAALRIDIHHLYVAEHRRAQGIGKALIRAACDHAHAIGASRLTIGTDAGNAGAIAAYRAMPMLEEITGTGPRFRVDLTL